MAFGPLPVTVEEMYNRNMTRRGKSLNFLRLGTSEKVSSAKNSMPSFTHFYSWLFVFRLFLEEAISDNDPHLENHFSTKRNDKPLAFLKKQNHLY